MSITVERDKHTSLAFGVADLGATDELDRHGPIPLYHQVYGAIAQDIRDGQLRRGEMLSTDAEIGDRFGASRVTVRQAIADLVHGCPNLVKLDLSRTIVPGLATHRRNVRTWIVRRDMEHLERRAPEMVPGQRLPECDPASEGEVSMTSGP